MNFTSIKSALHAQCLAWIEQRIATIRNEMQLAQAASNEETKSSAGDKYETTRAMLHLDMEKNATQLAEANKLKAVLLKIQPDHKTDVVQLGSIVKTDRGNFYLSISAGVLTINDETYTAISPASPLGSLMKGHKAGDEFAFNKKVFKVSFVE